MGSLVKSLGENDFYNLSQKFNANILDLAKKKEFFPINTRIVLKNLTNIYLVKTDFIVHWLIVKLVINIMNRFLTFEKLF